MPPRAPPEAIVHARATELIEALGLKVHPEGGHYRRVYTSTSTFLHKGIPRPSATAIHYLLRAGERSRWHCIDADEIWQHHEGDAIQLLLFDPRTDVLERHHLGRYDATTGSVPLVGVPAGTWQAARPLGAYSLLGCSVAPGFDFGGFQLLDQAPAIAARLAAIDPALLALA